MTTRRHSAARTGVVGLAVAATAATVITAPAAQASTGRTGHEETRRALDAVGALMRGELLKPEQLKAMKTTVFDSDYGLGIEKLTASCGKELWGQGGGWVGSLSYAATTEDGRHSFALNLNGDWDAGGVGAVLRAEFCDTP